MWKRALILAVLLMSIGCNDALNKGPGDIDAEEVPGQSDTETDADESETKSDEPTETDPGVDPEDTLPVQIGQPCDVCPDDQLCDPTFAFGGYCTAECESNADCNSSSNCVVIQGIGRCMSNCDRDSDCRDGYVCWDSNFDGTKECQEEPPGVGASCSKSDESCVEGFCAVFEHPDIEDDLGICTFNCGQPGEGCPRGYCLHNQICVRACDTDADCESDQFCAARNGLDKSCWPKTIDGEL